MPNLTPEQLAAIREAATRATQGKWRQHLVDETTVVAVPKSHLGAVDVCCTAPAGCGTDEQVDYETDAEQCERDAAYIVAAQPANVLALLADRDALAERVGGAEGLSRMVDHWRTRATAAEAEVATVKAQRDEAHTKGVALGRLTALAERDAMRVALKELVENCGPHTRLFLVTREKMNPTGIGLFDGAVTKARAALTPKQEKPDA